MSPTRERLIMRLEDAADFAEDGGHHIEVFANCWYKPDLNVNAEETPVGRRCHDAIERVGRHRRHPFDAITNGATTVENGAGFYRAAPQNLGRIVRLEQTFQICVCGKPAPRRTP
ncbi:hypothetical protein ACVIOG_006489 [Rhizobium leguminosarum]